MIGVLVGFALVRCVWICGLVLLLLSDASQPSVSSRWLLLVSLVVPSSAAYLVTDVVRALRRPRALDDRLSGRERFFRGVGIGGMAGVVSLLISLPLLGADTFGNNNTLIELTAAVFGAAGVSMFLRRPKAGRCFWCGYEQRDGVKCPECGRAATTALGEKHTFGSGGRRSHGALPALRDRHAAA